MFTRANSKFQKLEKFLLNFCILVGFMTIASTAHAVNFLETYSLKIAGVASDTRANIREQQTENVGYGAAFLIDSRVDERISVETGLAVFNRIYNASRANASITQEQLQVHVPLVARFWPVQFFSIGVGPFVEFKAGDTNTTARSNDSVVLQTSARNDYSLGIDFVAAVHLPISQKVGLFVDGRYNSLFNQEADEESDSLTVLAGINLGFNK